ncbi:MAG: dynamin family protein [Bryobacteraceae bacterium]|jgi:GTP-binding protein EngB required for normal cell division
MAIVKEALAEAARVCGRYRLAALEDFLNSCRAFAQEDRLNVAIFGRFKAGKSSFLNHLLGRPLLPVGAIPVTSVVTEIEYGPRERVSVRFLDGRTEPISPDQIGEFVAEERNPENSKQVAAVRVELPSMEPYSAIRFVDTPGLDSVFAHNTDASMEWLPNVGLALVAVGVDPPLSQRDIELIRNLSRFTPNISLLLTKIDLLEKSERVQVADFVRTQLARYWDGSVAVFPYSVRPGFEHLRAKIEEGLLSQAHGEAGREREAILRHKTASLLGECASCLTVALKAAQSADTEREQLRLRIVGQEESIEDARLALRLIVRHEAAFSRSAFEKFLEPDERPVAERLLDGLEREFPAWDRSLSAALEGFENWLHAAVTSEMRTLSEGHRSGFIEPVRRAGRQLSQFLEDFRNRLSQRTLEALGVPLWTAQPDLETKDPKSPDVRVGRIFDHNWELLSWVAPMAVFRGAVKRHFERTVARVVFMNLSRLASQWEAAVNDSLSVLEKNSLRRLDDLVSTIEALTAAAGQEAPEIQADLERIESLRDGLQSTR